MNHSLLSVSARASDTKHAIPGSQTHTGHIHRVASAARPMQARHLLPALMLAALLPFPAQAAQPRASAPATTQGAVLRAPVQLAQATTTTVTAQKPATQTTATDQAPLDTLAGLNLPVFGGKALDIKALKGKPVVINFWATWCPPCIREMPDLANLARELGDDAAIIGIAADSEPHVQKFTEKTPGIDFPLLMAGYKALNLSKQWGNEKGGLPFTVVLDAQGQIHWRHSGALDIEALRSMLKSGDLH